MKLDRKQEEGPTFWIIQGQSVFVCLNMYMKVHFVSKHSSRPYESSSEKSQDIGYIATLWRNEWLKVTFFALSLSRSLSGYSLLYRLSVGRPTFSSYAPMTDWRGMNKVRPRHSFSRGAEKKRTEDWERKKERRKEEKTLFFFFFLLPSPQHNEQRLGNTKFP